MHARLMDGDNTADRDLALPVDDLTAQTAPFRALPDEAPLAMPTQSLRAAPPRAPRPPSVAARRWLLRRFLVIGGAVALTVAGARGDVSRVRGQRRDARWRSSCWRCSWRCSPGSRCRSPARSPASVSLLAGGGCRLGTGPDAPLPQLSTRTALLMPTYNEQPARVMAGLQAIDESLARGRRGRCVRRVHPQRHHRSGRSGSPRRRASWHCATAPADMQRIFYRRRPKNIARKSGNIADWVPRFGGAYPQFLILDADSLMTGETLVRLVGAMERHPDVGLIQTLPIITGAHDAVRAHAAVRRPGLRPADRARHRVVARRRGQLLGPQRADPHARLCRAAPGCRNCAGRKPFGGHDHEPRLRRGRADAARRLGGPHGAGRCAAATRRRRRR